MLRGEVGDGREIKGRERQEGGRGEEGKGIGKRKPRGVCWWVRVRGAGDGYVGG